MQAAAMPDQQGVPRVWGALLAQLRSDPKFRRDIRQELLHRLRQAKLADYEPNSKQLEFHAAGKSYKERTLLAGNRLGKSYGMGMEDAMHATGRYPDWWQGRTFDEASMVMWIASESIELTRDGIQKIVAGPADKLGTGAIPADCIKDRTLRSGVVGAIDTLWVRRGGGGDTQGGDCAITFKSFDQGRSKFQAAAVHVVHLDEEPPHEIYTESVARTVDTRGIVSLTMTPLKGLTPLIKSMLYERTPFQHLTVMTLDDVNHYTDEEKRIIESIYPEHERDARLRGVPTIGSGAIYPVADRAIECDPFPIPAHWRWLQAIDFGFDHPFAWVLMAVDPDTDTIYVVDAYRKSKETPGQHVYAIRQRLMARDPRMIEWLPCAWPADGNQHEKGSGEQLAQQYGKAGLKMRVENAKFPITGNKDSDTNLVSVAAGISQILERMNGARLKVFRHLSEWFEEKRTYHRHQVHDERGVLTSKIVKTSDDLLDATRYGIMDIRFAVEAPKQVHQAARDRAAQSLDWRLQ